MKAINEPLKEWPPGWQEAIDRFEQLQRIVNALAACDPVAVDCSAWCPLCNGGGADGESVYQPEEVVHKPDCPWVLAQAAKGTVEVVR